MRLGRLSKKRVEHTVRDAAEFTRPGQVNRWMYSCAYTVIIGGRAPILEAFFDSLRAGACLGGQKAKRRRYPSGSVAVTFSRFKHLSVLLRSSMHS